MAELADALDLGSSGATRESSSLSFRTRYKTDTATYMQVSVEQSGLERNVTVDVPEERIAGAVEERLKSMSRTSPVQGFRPGKAPLRVIKQRFGARVRAEVVEKLVNSSFHEAISQEALKPVGPPHINLVRDAVGEGLSYTATFEVLPEIRLNPLEELRIVQPVCEITDADVAAMIDELRRQRSDFREVERPANKGDRVNIDLRGRVGNEEREDLKADGAGIVIGEGGFLPELEQALQGATAGQSLEVNLTLPEDSDNVSLSGKRAAMQIQVNYVEEAVLPELDADFFAGFGVSEGGEPAFRQQVRNQMEQRIEVALRKRLRDSVMESLYEANGIEVPNVLVNAEVGRMLELLARARATRGLDREDTSHLEESQDVQDLARRHVTLQLLTAELIRANELRAQPEKVRELIETRAQAYEDSAALINWYYNDQERLAEIEALALEDEVLDWVSARGRVEKLSLSFDELINKGQNQ